MSDRLYIYEVNADVYNRELLLRTWAGNQSKAYDHGMHLDWGSQRGGNRFWNRIVLDVTILINVEFIGCCYFGCELYCSYSAE